VVQATHDGASDGHPVADDAVLSQMDAVRVVGRTRAVLAVERAVLANQPYLRAFVSRQETQPSVDELGPMLVMHRERQQLADQDALNAVMPHEHQRQRVDSFSDGKRSASHGVMIVFADVDVHQVGISDLVDVQPAVDRPAAAHTRTACKAIAITLNALRSYLLSRNQLQQNN